MKWLAAGIGHGVHKSSGAEPYVTIFERYRHRLRAFPGIYDLSITDRDRQVIMAMAVH
jgi:hypothetical protein